MSAKLQTSLSSDGKTVRISTDTGYIDIDSEDIGMLFMLLSQAAQRHIEVTNQDPSQKVLHPVTWWNLHPTSNGSVAFIFKVQGGLEMAFGVDRRAASAIQETLAIHLGSAPPPAVPSNRQ